MPDAPDGIPWAVWLIAIVATPLLSAVATITAAVISNRRARAELSEAREQITEVRAQVSNSHGTNMRDDLDAASSSAALAVGIASRVERTVEDMLRTLRAVEHSIDRRDGLQVGAMTELSDDIKAVREELAEHLRDVPRIIQDAFARREKGEQ